MCKTLAWEALEIRRGRKTKFWNLGGMLELTSCAPAQRQAQAQPLALQCAVKTRQGRISNWATLEHSPLCSSMSMSAKKNKNEGFQTQSLTFSPLSSPSNSVSLPSPKISHVWYFYYRIPPLAPIHFLTILFLIDLPIDFLFEQVEEAMGSPRRRSKVSTMFLSIVWYSKVILKLKILLMSKFRKLFPKN